MSGIELNNGGGQAGIQIPLGGWGSLSIHNRPNDLNPYRNIEATRVELAVGLNSALSRVFGRPIPLNFSGAARVNWGAEGTAIDIGIKASQTLLQRLPLSIRDRVGSSEFVGLRVLFREDGIAVQLIGSASLSTQDGIGQAGVFGSVVLHEIATIRYDSLDPLAWQDAEGNSAYNWANFINNATPGELNNLVGNRFCFAKGTMVLMADASEKEIQDLRVGDEVLAFDGCGRLEARAVVRLYENYTGEFLELQCGTRVTPGHRYLRPDGRYMPIKEIVAGDGIVVNAAGANTKVSGKLVYARDSTKSEFVSTETIAHGNAAVQPNFQRLWRTYNFEVEGLHTYVADGFRVHNRDCIEDGDNVFLSYTDPETGLRHVLGNDRFGNPFRVVEVQDPLLGNVVIQRDVTFQSNDAVVTTTWTDVDEDGNAVGEPAREVAFPNSIITGEQIGSIFGSSIGQAIAGDNVFAQIAAGSALSAVLGNVGEGLHIYFNDTRSLSNPNSPSLDFGQSMETAFNDFGADLFNAVQGQAIGALSGFLTGELAENFGFDGGGFGDGLLRATTGSLINTVATNVVNGATGAAVFSNVVGNIGTGIGSFVGGYLAHQIVAPQNVGGAIGSSIGGALGTSIGAAIAGSTTLFGSIGAGVLTAVGLGSAIGSISIIVGGILLPGIGALIGTLIGTLLGNAIGGLLGTDEGWGYSYGNLDPATGLFVIGSHHTDDADFGNPAANTRTTVVEILNQFIGATGGQVTNPGDVSVRTQFQGDSHGGRWMRGYVQGVAASIGAANDNAADSAMALENAA